MSSDEVDIPSSPSAPASTGRRIRVRAAKRGSTSQEARPHLPSLPSDDNNDDWVSPFTLPPLPAFKKNRLQLDRSPEDKNHNRSGSSAYYAAAWGSPYATPSPSQSPAQRINRNKSLDLDTSPLASRRLGLDPSTLSHARQQSLPTHESVKSPDLYQPSGRGSPEEKSQRRNWLSESEDSDNEGDKRFAKTPTQRKFLSQHPTPSSVRSHQVQESVDTITPETFNGASSIRDEYLPTQNSLTMSEAQISSPSPAEEKPLPSLPDDPVAPEDSQANSGLVPAQSTPTIQRLRKKVPWKGKSCVIAMPVTNREQAGLPPVLTSEARRDLLQRWIDSGYPVHGFSVGAWHPHSDGAGGASRPTYPDPSELASERKTTAPNVGIPDQAEWEAWVTYLKEEKLRALGVTPSTSEAPPSTMSPFSSTMSRVSSAYPSNIAPSPPVPPLSAVSARGQMSKSPFSPILGNASSISHPALSQRGTPGFPGGRPMHGYAQSVAFPGMGQRMGSPFDQSIPQMGGFAPNVRSPDGQMNGRRIWTPGHVQNMQSMANISSPINPTPPDFIRQFSQSPHAQELQRQHAEIARQREQVQARLNHIRQMSMVPLRSMSQEQIQQLQQLAQIPLTPKAVSPEREPPEIMQPTPRSHRHNLSAALEKGVTDSVAASAKELSQVTGVSNGSKQEHVSEAELEEGEVVDEAEEEPPILHRPETLKNIDEKDEIETNPSIAGTPLLLDDQNPFASFKPLPPPENTNKRPGFGHSAQPSLSKLNVQAKEFSPMKATFSPNAGVFNFDGNAFASQQSSPGKSVAAGPRFGHKHNPSSLGLNVSAAVFMPSFASKPASEEQTSAPASARISRDFHGDFSSQSTVPFKSALEQSSMLNAEAIPEEPSPAKPVFDPEASAFSFGGDDVNIGTPAKQFDPRASAFSFVSNPDSSVVTPAKTTPSKGFDPNASTFSTFSFGSGGFNVEAPEFKPSGIAHNPLNLPAEKDFVSDVPAYTGSMFGDVVINRANKPERRTKALPIVKPQSREGSVEPTPTENIITDKENFDMDGRASAPAERHKRAKTMGLANGDILFAASAPFTSLAAEAAEEPVEDTVEQQEETIESLNPLEPSKPSTIQAPDSVDVASTLLSRTVDSAATGALESTGTPDLVNHIASIPGDEQVLSASSTLSPAARAVADIQQGGQTEPSGASPVVPSAESTSTPPSTVKSATGAYVPPHRREAAKDVEQVSPLLASADSTAVTAPATSGGLDKEVRDNPDVGSIVEPEEQHGVKDLPDAIPIEIRAESPTMPAQDVQPQPESSAPPPASDTDQATGAAPPAGLSALAQPFEFSPFVQEFEPKTQTEDVASDVASPAPKKGGLMASRFAASPPREPSAPQMVERNTSPPQTLFGEKETIGASRLTSKSKMGSETVADHLAKYREHDSASASVVSQVGDLSFEEINAVMKQFEEDPDLGIIREDTPVKSTPLIDMRYQQQFRSDAPSPSPNRRLDKPFDPAGEHPYGGLGFDMSGVHQLNYGGSGEISDWNAELSPGQQDKLEARAQFFDDHVNDIVDHLLENRLAPLERTLQSIQSSLQQGSTKLRHSRRSMSTEGKESDADDEDDYDAYEGFSHYRSRSPTKRNRQQERIKAAVMEAMTVAQSTMSVPQVDLTSIHNALEEMKDFAQLSALGSYKQKEQLRHDDIKSAVRDAMQDVELRPTAPPPIDLSSIQNALDEIREYGQLSTLSSYKQKEQLRQDDIKAAVVEALRSAHQENPASQIDLSHVHNSLNELMEHSQRSASKTQEMDAAEFQRAVAELKALTAQRAVEPQLDAPAIHHALAEIRQIAAEKPVMPELDLSAVLQELSELKSQGLNQPSQVDLSEIMREIIELKAHSQSQSAKASEDVKVVLEDVINSHPRFATVQRDGESGALQQLQSKIVDLQAMLKVAEKRADGEAALRREAEEENDNLHRHLKDARDQATSYKEASEQAQKSLSVFAAEKQDYHGVNVEVRDLRDKNEALEKTLQEYRNFREEMKEEVEKERARTDNLARALHDARIQHRDQLDSRDLLREQLKALQDRTTKASEDLRHEEAEWRKREHDLLSKNQLLQAALDHETNRRARMELEAEKLSKDHRESLAYRSRHDTVQEEVSRLSNIIVGLQKENKSYQDAAYTAQRELAFIQDRQAEIVATNTVRLQEELETSRSIHQNLQSDSDARIARLQGQLDTAGVEMQEIKAKHDTSIEKMFESHNTAIKDIKDQHAVELEQRLALHEERLVAIKAQHDREIKIAEEDRQSLRERFMEKLALSEDKSKHLESRIEDLKHSLEISQKAARAAADSAISKGANLPTPASSVIASPPHRPSISSASVPLQRGSDLPEKISPQALRETIMVLQDQLQNREQRIDKLEAELASIDKTAPAKVKERDTEIVMLRELLDVRIDDLSELIATLEKPDYNRQAVKDATIRLKTQIKMDQQLRERAITGTNNLPATITSGISNLTQSPRAMVAAAAWGNWRKIRDSGVGNVVSDFANNISQTPSRSNSTSSSAMAGITSPPTTNKSGEARPSTARHLSAVNTTRKAAAPSSPSAGARPLRSFSSQPRTLSGKQPGRRGTNESRPGSSGSTMRSSGMKIEPPSTPTQANIDSDFGDDVDDDASPLDGKDRGFDSDLADEPPKPVTQTTPRASRTSRSSTSKPTISPRTSRSSRHSSGKPVSPRALRASAGVAHNDVVEVFEEE